MKEGYAWIGSGESRTTTASTQKTHLAVTMNIHKQAFLSGLVFVMSKDHREPQWRPSLWPSYLGACRFSHVSVFLRRQGEEILVVMGGCAQKTRFRLNSVVHTAYLNVQSKKWQKGPCMHEKRSCPASVICNNSIYVIGGFNGFHTLDTIERIHVDDLLHSSSASSNCMNGWNVLDCRLSTPRWQCAAAVVYDRFIVVAGGRCFFGLDKFSSVEIIDTASGNACSIIPGPCLQVARCCFGMAVVGHRIYVVGGMLSSSVEYLDFDELLDDSPNCAASVFSLSKSWTIHNRLCLNRLGTINALVQVGSCLVVAGGCKAGSKLAMEVLDTVNCIVWELPSSIIKPSCVCCMVALSSGIVAMKDDSFETLSIVDKNSWLFARLVFIGKVSIK